MSEQPTKETGLPPWPQEVISVSEDSNYARLRRSGIDYRRAEAALARLRVAVKALKFYASRDADSFGVRARAALSEIGELP